MHSTNCRGALLRLLEMGISIQELTQSINIISNQRLITTTQNERRLICETIDKSRYNFSSSMNKQCHIILIIYKQLNLLSKEGTICEDTASKYF